MRRLLPTTGTFCLEFLIAGRRTMPIAPSEIKRSSSRSEHERYDAANFRDSSRGQPRGPSSNADRDGCAIADADSPLGLFVRLNIGTPHSQDDLNQLTKQSKRA